MKILVLSFALVLPSNASEQPTPPKVQAEWAKFQSAVKGDDPKALLGFIRFPVRSNEFGGNINSAKVLVDRYKTIFPAPTKQCLGSSDLQIVRHNGRVHYEAFCDVSGYPICFIFSFDGSRLLLTSIDNINE